MPPSCCTIHLSTSTFQPSVFILRAHHRASTKIERNAPMSMMMVQLNRTGNRINIQPRFLTTPAIYFSLYALFWGGWRIMITLYWGLEDFAINGRVRNSKDWNKEEDSCEDKQVVNGAKTTLDTHTSLIRTHSTHACFMLWL